jgi:monoterpene epsilon-lactone hydrolase
MTPSSTERNIRRSLPITRFLTAYLPLSVTRWVIQRSMARVDLPADVTREGVSADGVPCDWLIPRGSPDHRVLLYLHGGGFGMGLTSLHLQIAAYLAQKMGTRALLVDYRLAPEHPFPAALDDCLTAYRWLLKRGTLAENVVVAGDSAGGNLAITTLMTLRDGGDPLPAAAACLSPVADLTEKEDPSKEIHDPLLHPRATRVFNRAYIGHNDAREPLISPVFGNWEGLPPLLIHAGEDEVLRRDAARIEELASEAGVDVRLEIYPRMWHVWQVHLKLPQATQSLDDIAQFLRSHLGETRAF